MMTKNIISTTCMEFSRSLASPGLACELQHREQLNQVVCQHQYHYKYINIISSLNDR